MQYRGTGQLDTSPCKTPSCEQRGLRAFQGMPRRRAGQLPGGCLANHIRFWAGPPLARWRRPCCCYSVRLLLFSSARSGHVTPAPYWRRPPQHTRHLRIAKLRQGSLGGFSSRLGPAHRTLGAADRVNRCRVVAPDLCSCHERYEAVPRVFVDTGVNSQPAGAAPYLEASPLLNLGCEGLP
jgi:hypothetical protein